MEDTEESSPEAAPTAAAAGALAAEYADRLVVGTVRDVHRAVSARTFAFVGPVGAPVRLVHDGVSSAVFGLLSAGLRGVHRTLRLADRRGMGGPPLALSRPGRRVEAVVNGLIGGALVDAGDPMAIGMSARVGGRDVRDLSSAFPDATGDVVIFVHGLVEDDESWRWCADETGATYADRLREDTAWTPVTLRFNTGLPVVRNGQLLSEWITRMLDAWPTPVRRIALVGHSMGGLVALAACEHDAVTSPVRHPGQTSARGDAQSSASSGGRPGRWTPLLRHVVCLGTPHLGAPLEQLVHWGARMLSISPESSPFATILNTRSAGILDLRQAVLECTPLEHASYHCVSGSLGGPLGPVLGDLLVRRHSATGRIPGATSQHLPNTHHFRLLNHPEVYAELLARLTTDPSREETA